LRRGIRTSSREANANAWESRARSPRVELQREFQALEGRLGKGMVFVTHDVREGLRLGTRIGLMHEGRLAFLGTPEEFRRSEHPECRAFMAAA